MSIWGKLVGGGTGLAVGGPLGGLLGTAAGHALDKVAIEPPRNQDNSQKVAFTIAVIALSAKMAKADGVVTDREIQAFHKLFKVPPGEAKNVRKVFDRAKRDTAGFEGYARQVARLFPDRPAVLEELLDSLFHIAKADGRVTPNELAYLRRVAERFGLSHQDFERVRATHLGQSGTGRQPAERESPYAVLGIDPAAGDDEVKAAHRRLLKDNHPDQLSGQGVPQEFIDVATRKMATINAAYDRIRAERGLS